jgi:uncharacterized integral membrane protein
MKPKNIAITLIVGFLLVFVLQNSATVELRFLFWKAEMSRVILVFLVFAAGIVAGLLARAGRAR